ncbi:AAA family ATPase [Sphingobium vermicomposti]|uniref:Pilus assembly protein CpaE n=1 Tax=Sphingobium vermicomposti TaxID=529005 RepID=A0A846MA33_9SPHN|nr:histidine kinase [Sphingobium vermicomposti]NIJ18108.1 pilus assembly protein CpaE [Sphingobium vermicomposti]
MANILLLSVDRSLAERIEQAMNGRATVEMAQSVASDLPAGPAVIVIDRTAIPPERSITAAIAAVAEVAGGRAIVLATSDCDADEILRAVRAGADDIIPRQGEGGEISDILWRLINEGNSEQNRGGRLTLVVGADQEVAAMVATDMAVSRAGERSPAVLIDCTMPTSAAQAYLDLSVGYGMAAAIGDMERLDASLLSSALARHGPSGLLLLTFDGGTGAEPVGIGPTDIAALVRLLRTCCAEVVLSVGSLRHAGLLRDLGAQADRIELLCAQSIRELEASRRLIDRMGADGAVLAKTRLVVWDHQPSVLLDGRRMADILGISTVHPLPVDHARARNALNAGQPMAMEKDGGPYMQAIRRMCGIQPPAPSAAFASIDRVRRAVRRTMERAS